MNPVLFKLGSFEVRYYGLMYAIAFFLGLKIAEKLGKEKNISRETIESYGFVAMISGLIGGRLYYVLFNLDYYLNEPMEIFKTWHGGMAIHGGIIGGIIGTFIYGYRKKINPLLLGDIVAAPMILGQALGRIGNFMNGEIHGVPVFTPWSVIFSLKPRFYEWYNHYLSLDIIDKLQYKNLVPFGVVFPTSSQAGMEFPNVPVHPAMLYELVLNFIGFLLLYFVIRKIKNKAPGYVWWWYIIIYSVNRIIVSFFRAEDLMIYNYRAPHIISAIMIIFAVIFIVIGNRKKRDEITKN